MAESFLYLSLKSLQLLLTLLNSSPPLSTMFNLVSTSLSFTPSPFYLFNKFDFVSNPSNPCCSFWSTLLRILCLSNQARGCHLPIFPLFSPFPPFSLLFSFFTPL